MTDRFVDGQPELPAITAPQLQFAQGFPNGVFQLDVERRVAAERGGDAQLCEVSKPHATIRWAEYKFGALRRMMNRKETRSIAYLTELRFGYSPESRVSDKEGRQEKSGNDSDPDSPASAASDESGFEESRKGIAGSVSRQEFRQAYHSLCSYADRMTEYACQLPVVIARDPSSLHVLPLAKEASEQVKQRAEAACKAVALVEKFANEISYTEKEYCLPPQWEPWAGSLADFWVGRSPAPLPNTDDKEGYQWSDFVPRLLHWVQHRGLPLLPDDLIHTTAYVEFVDRKLGHFPLPSNRTVYEWVTEDAGHCRYRTMVERWAPLSSVARRLGIDYAEKEWGRDLLDVRYHHGVLTLPEIVCATDTLRLTVNYDLPKVHDTLVKYSAAHPGELDVVFLAAKLLLHIRKVRGLYRTLIFAGRHLGEFSALNGKVPRPWAPWTGESVYDDPLGNPSEQTDVLVGGRLSEYVFHLVVHVNAKGLPEYGNAELREAVQKASVWDRAQAHARQCFVCRSKATNLTATPGSGPTDTSLLAPTHSVPSASSLGVIYPECLHSSSERGGGSCWSGGGGGGGSSGFDGGSGGFSGGGGGDCGGSSSW